MNPTPPALNNEYIIKKKRGRPSKHDKLHPPAAMLEEMHHEITIRFMCHHCQKNHCPFFMMFNFTPGPPPSGTPYFKMTKFNFLHNHILSLIWPTIICSLFKVGQSIWTHVLSKQRMLELNWFLSRSSDSKSPSSSNFENFIKIYFYLQILATIFHIDKNTSNNYKKKWPRISHPLFQFILRMT